MLLLCGAAPAADGQPSARVLFIGNSLTYVNDLPAMIEAVAAQAGLKGRITCRAVALPGFSLEDHWNDGRALRALQQERWTLAVLQQGPTTLPESEASLRTYAKKFAFEASARGTKVALYGVWPPLSRIGSFDRVAASYSHAAADVSGAVVPVGEGWRAAWRRDPSLLLYGADNFHPSPLGTYLAALMFFEHLTGRSPIGLPGPSRSKDRALRDVHVAPAQLRVLQEAAAEANAAAAGAARTRSFRLQPEVAVSVSAPREDRACDGGAGCPRPASAGRESARCSYPAAPAPSRDAVGRQMPGAQMRRW
jgi:hypothetical protein